MPDLQTVSDSSEEPNDLITRDELPEPKGEPTEEDISMFQEKEAYTLTFDYVFMAKTASNLKSVHVKLYNSGVSWHMSPYRDWFINFIDIKSHPIGSADNRTFQAVSKGDMYIDMSHETSTCCILLKDVLHAPDMRVMLISVSRITAAGYGVVFHNNSCHIYNTTKEVIGEVKASGGLYRVYHPTDYAAKVAEVLALGELHCHLGHISFDAAWDLVRKGLVLGVELDDSEPPEVCKSCEHAKITQKPIQREYAGDRVKNIGNEVHSDVWDPAPVEIIGGC